jgi:hypothetical protein
MDHATAARKPFGLQAVGATQGQWPQTRSQSGHPGSGPELLPIARVNEMAEHHPDACRRCNSLLEGEYPVPLHHQVIEITAITPLVIEHRLHRLVRPCRSTSTCVTLTAEEEASHYRLRLSALLGLLGSAFPLRFSKSQALLDQLLGIEISRVAIATICQRLSAASAQPMQEAPAFACQQPVLYVAETGAPTGNADGNNPTRKRGWQFEGKRQIPFLAVDQEIGHGRDITWTLRAKEAPEHIREAWVCTSWIVEVATTGTRDGKWFIAKHIFLTSLRTCPKALLRQSTNHGSIEGWHWFRDTQLNEDAHRYRGNGAGVM